MTIERPATILDCDPGLDDCVAIALALAHTDLVGITTVGGNVGVEHTTANALAITELLGRPDVPVHAGHDDPLTGTRPRRAPEFHGPTGTADVTLTPRRPAGGRHAVDWMIDTVRATPGLWLIATGPLTNVADAVRRASDLVEHLAGISWMGGSASHGNTTAAAEFNAYADPEAAAIVFAAGHPNLSMAGLHVTQTVLLDRPWIARLATAIGDGPTALFPRLLAHYEARTTAATTLAGTPVHDALAVVRVSHPHLIGGTVRPVEIVTAGAARGMTLVDQRPHRQPPPGNCLVLDRADAGAIRALIASTLVG